MTTMASQITSASRLFTQPFIQTQIKENIKAPRHWPLCGGFTGTGEFPAQRASNAENVSIWWRHHDGQGTYSAYNQWHINENRFMESDLHINCIEKHVVCEYNIAIRILLLNALYKLFSFWLKIR